MVLPLRFAQRLLRGECAPAPRAPDGLELPELLLRVAFCLGVVDELVDERALAARAGQVVRAPSAEGRVCWEDRANLGGGRTSVQDWVTQVKRQREREREREKGREREREGRKGESETYGKVLGEALDALALAGLLAVELLRVELLVQAERLDFAVHAREVGLGRRGEVEPCFAGCCILHLRAEREKGES